MHVDMLALRASHASAHGALYDTFIRSWQYRMNRWCARLACVAGLGVDA